MKFKATLFPLLGLGLAAASANAAVISVGGVNPDAIDSATFTNDLTTTSGTIDEVPGGGTSKGIVSALSGTPLTGTTTVYIGGLNINGGTDDSVIVTFNSSATDSSGTPSDVSYLGDFTWSVPASGKFVQDGEALLFDGATVTVSLDGGASSYAGQWLGFTHFGIGSGGGGEWIDASDGGSYNGTGIKTLASNQLALTLTGRTSTNRIYDLGFQIDTVPVPEPSALALAGLGLLGLLRRRR